MRRKLRRRTGFTLAETLLAIMILSLVTAAGTAGVTAVLAVRNRMVQTANAQVLASAAAEAIADELRFGRSIAVAGHEVTLDSARFDAGRTLCLSDASTADARTPGGRTVPAGRLVMRHTETAADPAAGGDPTTKTVLREVLGEDLYDELRFSDMTFTLQGTAPADTTVQVALTVADSAGDTLWKAEFTVVPLNGANSA